MANNLVKRWVCLATTLLFIFEVFFVAPSAIKSQTPSFKLDVSPGCGQNTLKWEVVSGASNYWIYRGPAEGQEFETPLTDFPIPGTSFVDNINIQNGTKYCYVVKALDKEVRVMAQSNEVCATPKCEEEPPKKEDLCKLVLKFQVGNKAFWVNDSQRLAMETAPEIASSRMFLLVKYVADEIGAAINWEPITKTAIIATLDGVVLEIQVGNPMARINGVKKQIDPNNPAVVAYIKNSRTLLPMRFVAENLGAKRPEDVKWQEDTKTVVLYFKNPACQEQQQTQVMSTQINLCSWWCFRGNSLRNGSTFNLCGQLPAKPKKIWQFKTGGAVVSSPIVVSDKVFVTSSDKKLYCLEAGTGKKLWETVSFQGEINNTPCFDEGHVFVGGTILRMAKFNADTGALVWKTQDGYWVESSPVARNGKIFFGFSDGIIAIKSTNILEKVWSFKTGKLVKSSPAISNDGKSIFCGCEDGKMYCLNAENGQKKWEFSTGAPIKTTPAYMGDKIYFGSDNGYFYCLSESTGGLVWKTKLPREIRSSASAAGTSVYFGCGNGKMYCLNAATGSIKWELIVANSIDSSPALIQGVLAVGASYTAGGQELVLIDAASGKKLWSQLGCGGASSPAYSDGKVFVGSKDGNVYCFGEGEEGGSKTIMVGFKFPIFEGMCNWICQQGNAQKTSEASNICGPSKTVLAQKWEYETYIHPKGEVICSGGRVFFQSSSGLLCLDANKGNKLWLNSDLKVDYYPPNPTPVAVEGKVYAAGGTNGWLYCLDASTGKKLWSLPTLNPIKTNLTYHNKRLYFAMEVDETATGKHIKYFCLNTDTKETVWEFDVTPSGIKSWSVQSFSPVAVYDQNIYFVHEGHLYCLNANTGQKKWSKTEGNFYSPIAINGKLIAGGNSQVSCFDANSGAPLWSFSKSSEGLESGVCVANGKVFFCMQEKTGYNLEARIYCLELGTGNMLWNTKNHVEATPTYCDGKLFVVSSTNILGIFNANDGSKIWESSTHFYDYSHPYPASSQPCISYGKVIWHGNDLKIHCFADAP